MEWQLAILVGLAVVCALSIVGSVITWMQYHLEKGHEDPLSQVNRWKWMCLVAFIITLACKAFTV